jgi:hypothetical protein
MYLVDEENHIIHDMSFVKYECQIKKIPEDKRHKLFNIESVKRMVNTDHIPPYNGCQFCLSEHHQFDMTSIFKR